MTVFIILGLVAVGAIGAIAILLRMPYEDPFVAMQKRTAQAWKEYCERYGESRDKLIK